MISASTRAEPVSCTWMGVRPIRSVILEDWFESTTITLPTHKIPIYLQNEAVLSYSTQSNINPVNPSKQRNIFSLEQDYEGKLFRKFNLRIKNNIYQDQ